MVRFAPVFAHRLMAVQRKNTLVSIPEITERVTAFVGQRDPTPKLKATGFTAISTEISHNLPCPATQGYPDPAFVGFLEHKGPQLVQFQHIFQLGISQRGFQRGQLLRPLLNPLTGSSALYVEPGS
jgi:hypothetical protein